MKIDRVTFRTSIELEKFQHAHVEASAPVSAKEKPEAVMEELKTFVIRQLKVAKYGEAISPPPKTGRVPRKKELSVKDEDDFFTCEGR